MLVRGARRDQALLVERLHHRLARLLHLHAREPFARVLGHQAVLADHGHHVETVLAADLKVVRVVPGGDLQRAGAELGIHVLVGDHGEPAAHERQDRGLADQSRVALVVRVHCDGGVGQHRLGPHGGHGDRAGARLEGVVDRVEHVLHAPLLHLEVRDRRAETRVPVDHVVVAVDQPLLVQPDEHVHDRLHVVVVHREALVLVVEGGAKPFELLDDRGAVLLAPLPYALDKCLAPDLLAARAFRGKLLLHLNLGGDAGVVGAEDPLGAAALHAPEADQRVLDRAVERVAHVKHAGHVRRRDGYREVLAGVARGLRMEDPGVVPAREHAGLHVRRRVAGALSELL